MQIDNINQVGVRQTATERAKLTRDQFLKILITELTRQDPISPMDSTDFLNQIIGLHTIENMATLTDSMKSMQRFLNFNYASGLLNKVIKGVNIYGENVFGLVTKVILEDDGIFLWVNNQRVPIENVVEVLPSEK